jgi:hypothetical protein
LTTIVSKVEAVGPKSFHMDLPLLENRFQFRRHLQGLSNRKEEPAIDTETEMMAAEVETAELSSRRID